MASRLEERMTVAMAFSRRVSEAANMPARTAEPAPGVPRRYAQNSESFDESTWLPVWKPVEQQATDGSLQFGSNPDISIPAP